MPCHRDASGRYHRAELDGGILRSAQAAPLIGSVKSNFGHLLTAAGMGGMLKVILSMANNRMPATIKVREPHTSQNNLIGERQIVRQAMDWPQQ